MKFFIANLLFVAILLLCTAQSSTSLLDDNVKNWISDTFMTIPLCNTSTSCTLTFDDQTSSVFSLESVHLPATIQYNFSIESTSNDNPAKFVINQIKLILKEISALEKSQTNLVYLVWPGDAAIRTSQQPAVTCPIEVTLGEQLLSRFQASLAQLSLNKLSHTRKRSLDQKLKFTRNQFNFKYLFPNENDLIGRLNLNLDYDMSSLSIACKPSYDMFDLNSRTLEIKFKPKTMNSIYETFTFKVIVLDARKNVITQTSVRIEVIDLNQSNRAPVFSQSVYEAQIVENNAPDTLVTRVEARDDDYAENGHITYHFVTTSDSNLVPFQIKSDTGEIYAKKMLDREQKDSYSLNVMVIDNGLNRLSSLAQVNIRVIAQLDDSPRFSQKEYNLTLADNTDYWLKPNVLKVSALDADNSSSLVYSLSGSLNDMNTFEIDTQSGIIRLVSKLNSELKNQYKLNVIARDLSQPPRAAYAPLTISIEDAHVNPPVFTAPFYEFILFENVPVGYLVGRTQAVDKRKRLLSYSIQSDLVNDSKFPFSINELNGTIQTVKKIYKNYKHGYEFNVIALVKNLNNLTIANSTVRVKVKILDINDQVPLFSKSSYRINITEESAVGLPLLVLTTKTRDPNSVLDYSIESGNENEMFSLVKQDNERAFLTLERSNLNYKKQSVYNLNVKVMDQDGLYSLANVVVSIMPKDGNMPRFSQDIYNFQVHENAPLNFLVGSLQASSPNSYDIYSSRIVYKLIQNNENDLITSELNDLFRLDELTGNLYVSSYLDREKYESVSLYVTATNYNDKTPLVDHALIQIQILDVNDNAPVFTRQAYEINVFRNTKPGSYLLRVEAIDKDLNQNGQVKYSLEETSHGSISVDSTSGVIRLCQFNSSVDSIRLTLTASDAGQPGMSSSAQLIVNYLNEDNLAPVFDRSILVFYLYESQPVGTIVGEIRARDPDSGKQANIIYKLIDSQELFELKPSGKFNAVLLASKFTRDFDSHGRNVFEFTIRAYSSYSHSDCLIRVYVKELNDMSPNVPKSFKVIFNNYKNYFLTEKSAYVPVQSVDSFTNLTFRLLDSVGKQVVDLDAKTGKLTFKPILNSNNQINISFLIGVNDGQREMVTQCELLVLMLSDSLISESVSLSLPNLDTETFLNYLYDRLMASLLKILTKSSVSNIHIFNLVNSTTSGLNLSLAVSYDYEKDVFMPGHILKQILNLNSDLIAADLNIARFQIYEDLTCAIEPCLNYQQCVNSIKFSSASSDFLQSSYIQFRSISIQHDFKCACPVGFTGTNSSFMCDLEVNLCYSNPCSNNGVCISLESSFMCVCDAGFTGRLCEFNLNKLKCCDSTDQQTVTVSKASQLMIHNKKNASLSSQQKCAASSLDFPFSGQATSNLICKGDSKCKNLILGGIVCDKCTSSEENKMYYNQFCELRTKHFPHEKHAFIALAGIQNRFRFKIKLTFATVKSDGYLFYNGRLNQPKSADFVSLQIENSHLVFSYSLGDNYVNRLELNDLAVNDGKWRTVTLEYKNQHVVLALDNDRLFETDACEFAYNQNKTESDCYRLKKQFELPEKCLNQIETCFRYFDLNGPLKLGQGPAVSRDIELSTKLNFEGCIGDVYLNEKLVDLQRDTIQDVNTEIGCSPKQNYCAKANHQCAKCEHVWLNKINCECASADLDSEAYCMNKSSQDEQIYSLKGTGYLALKEQLIKNHLDIQFKIRLSSTTKSVILANFELFTKLNDLKEKSQVYYLVYEARLVKLISETNQIVSELAFNLDDSFWHQIRLDIHAGHISLLIDDYFKLANMIEFEQTSERYIKVFIGGNGNQIEFNSSSLSGCLKQIDSELILLRETVDMHKDCSIDRVDTESSVSSNVCSRNVCFNSGNCTETASNGVNCTCLNGYKGKLCQYENKSLTRNLLTNQNNCPAKWWGQEQGICGPCNCDESKNFSPDCNKTNGQCECKPKFYKKINPITKEEQCVPCECYLEGSASLQCEPLTGQCLCLVGAGITGRKCDQCVSPFAEMTSKGNECRQLSTNECPKSFKFDIWWPRTPFNKLANASCPKGSIGTAYRYCNDLTSWSPVVDLRDCKSLKIIDSQLAKWTRMLHANKSQLNSYQALQLAQDLNQITLDADLDDDLNDLEESFSTSVNSLYAHDLIVIKNLTKYIIQYEIDNAPSYLYIQDKHFLQNIFSTLNRILSRKYEKKLRQLLLSPSQNDSFSSNENIQHTAKFHLTDLLVVLDKYLQSIVQNDQYNHLDKLDLSLANFKMFMSSIKSQAFAHTSMSTVKFKLITTQTSIQKINFIQMTSLPSSLPHTLLIESSDKLKNKLSHNYRVVSNVLMVNLQQSVETNNKKLSTNSSNKSLYLVVDFVITNLFETTYDYSNDKLNYRRMSDTNYVCAYLNQETGYWSTKGAKLVAYDFETNTVKCSYDHFSIYAVVTSVNGLVSSGSKPVNFFLASYIVMPIVYLIHLITIILLVSLRKHSTPLSQIYLNLTINILIVQLLFLFGVNNNNSQILCKFTAIAQHYFHLSSYLWMLLIVVHLYRILTELRDINKVDSHLPVFYYAIALVVPALFVILTLGIKQELYTNYSFLAQLYSGNAFTNYFSSTLYCWLCTTGTNFYEIFYVLLLPIGVVTLFLFVFSFLCYKESKRTTFKQADVPFVTQNLFSCIVLLPGHYLITFFILMTVYTSVSSLSEFTVYQYLYLGFSLLYSLVVLLALVLLNKSVREMLVKSWTSLCSKSAKLNESLDTSKLKLYNRSPNLKEPVKQEIFKTNPKYILDYRDFQAHSISTTTTSGTIDDTEYQGNHFMSTSNGYLSHLANTTNTESTANESEFTSQFDFNRPAMQSTSEISESDVIDVGKILKSRVMTGSQMQTQPDNNYQIRPEFTKGQIIENQVSHAVKKATPSLQLFWPTTVAECDTSFLDGSALYSPAKLPFSKNVITVPEILSVNKSNANTLNRNMPKNNSYNSNSSNSASNSNNCSNSTSSLILNSNSVEQQVNKNTEIFNHVSPQKFVAILTHTGSPTTSDNDESGNETRV